jgi:hypothetical protein
LLDLGASLTRPSGIDRRTFITSSLAAASLTALSGSSSAILSAQQSQHAPAMSKPSLIDIFSPLHGSMSKARIRADADGDSMSEKHPLLAEEAECFYMTSPFIEPDGSVSSSCKAGAQPHPKPE